MPSPSGRLSVGRFTLPFRTRPWIMGILNVTPDSFSDGGCYLNAADAIDRASQMVAEGAEIIDVGGESTRPGSPRVKLDEELQRVIPVVRALATRLPVPISVDTSKADVARAALEAGASMINDVTALRGDPEMAAIVARAGVPIILMHMKSTPQTMQRAPRYRDVVAEVKTFLVEAMKTAQAAGIAREQILLDPGLGFGKTVSHNLQLLHGLDQLAALGRPFVIGPSRKSFIGTLLEADTDERLAGTLACVGYGAEHGVRMVRVHDVKPVMQFLTMWSEIDHAAGRQHRSRRHRAASAVGTRA